MVLTFLARRRISTIVKADEINEFKTSMAELENEKLPNSSLAHRYNSLEVSTTETNIPQVVIPDGFIAGTATSQYPRATLSITLNTTGSSLDFTIPTASPFTWQAIASWTGVIACLLYTSPSPRD